MEKVFLRAFVATLGFTGFSYLFKQFGLDDGITISLGNVVRAYIPALCTVTLIHFVVP